MPRNRKAGLGTPGTSEKDRLDMPVIGMEAEFNVWLDEKEIIPEDYWKHPKAFIDAPLLKREKTSSHIPTGGAVYFDRGVIEVVTPVIEISEGCTARVVRNLWEQIGFVRDQLTQWGERTDHTVRLKAYSSHYNISYEIPKSEQTAQRNEKKLALLLAFLLPVPVMITASNRRSTGVGVRPRGGRIEITVDFTPDPGLMIATATLIVGIVREVMHWPSYELEMLDEMGLPVIADVIPGKHTTRKGWLTKDFHYPQSPYTADIDERMWQTRDGRTMSLRGMANQIACFFKKSIRKNADPFSFRLLFAIMDGLAPSMLDLQDRPLAYEDVGRLCRWGMVTHELRSFQRESEMLPVRTALWESVPYEQHLQSREEERQKQLPALRAEAAKGSAFAATSDSVSQPVQRAVGELAQRPASRSLMPRRPSDFIDRRRRGTSLANDRRRNERRKNHFSIPFPDRRLTRSAYELVFLKLVSGSRLNMDGELLTPVGMKGWYNAIFRRPDGSETLVTIDQLLQKMSDWV